jgi:hypothetical protein
MPFGSVSEKIPGFMGIIILLVFLIFVIALLQANRAPANPNIIHIVPGNYQWEVYVDGIAQTWSLAYANYDSLPVHNSDYNRDVEYLGKRYRVMRVWSNQLQFRSDN